MHVDGAEQNIGGDPIFMDVPFGDFHLHAGSPCIDAGKSTTLDFDFEGDARPFDGTDMLLGDGSDYDIGADEYTGPPIDIEALYGGFVDQLYRDFLQRESDAGGHFFYLNNLRTGEMTPEIIARNFMDSPEFADFNGFVARCYFGLFNDNSTIAYNHPDYRIPDSAGLVDWHGEMKTIIAAGGDEYDAKLYVVYGLLGSAEWNGRDLSLTNEEFIELLYHRILGRKSDADGMNHHLWVLNSGWLTREETVLFFLESPEARGYFKRHTYVTMAYLALLQRAPEREGFIFHMQRLNLTSFDVLDFLRNIIYSPEYRDRLAALGISFFGG